MEQERIRELEREKDLLLEQWMWADRTERVKILIRRMELQDMLEDLRQTMGG
ncbi:MAG: chromosome segregation protein SMC [Alicyclobacillaceae bacterium]|nr:chromosome segregation protein SMC [Alicyclobacillaceae bacterium]